MRAAIAAQRTGFTRGVVAGELRSAGGAQTVAEARNHDLESFVGKAHAGRRGALPLGPSGNVIE